MIEELIDLLEKYCRARPTCDECPFIIEHNGFRLCREDRIITGLEEEKGE